MNTQFANADGDPSDEEFTPPLITPKEMSGAAQGAECLLFPET